MARAEDLVEGLRAEATIADKDYDADRLEAKLVAQCSRVVIPSRRHRKVAQSYGKALYKEGNLIKRFFAKLKHFRRVVARYDKLLANFLVFVKISAIAIMPIYFND